MVRALLIEDLAVVRESLALGLASGGDIEVRSCATPQEAIRILAEPSAHFDVVLLKQGSGAEKADQLLSIANRNGLKGRVLILTPWVSEMEHRRLTALGVAGIFDKQRPLADLIEAVRKVGQGQPWFDRPAPPKAACFIDGLTVQESRVCGLVFEGLTNKEVGLRLGVTESCIKAVLQRVFLKLGVRNRGQLVRLLSDQFLRGDAAAD